MLSIYKGCCAALAVATSIAFPLAAVARTSGGEFDKPIRIETVKLPTDPQNPQAKRERTCHFYPGFMVKEVDLGEKGADKLSITPALDDFSKLACEDTNSRERVIDPTEWSGYFAGAKGHYVIFDADDGQNGGMPFAVYDAVTGRKLFEESRQGDAFEAIKLVNGDLVLRYRRVFLAPCSIYADAKGCWGKLMETTSLAFAARPDCAPAYDREIRRETKYTPQFAKDVPGLPSVISYEVEARYSGDTLHIAPRPGRVGCGLED